jgi:hypothetical protein
MACRSAFVTNVKSNRSADYIPNGGNKKTGGIKFGIRYIQHGENGYEIIAGAYFESFGVVYVDQEAG